MKIDSLLNQLTDLKKDIAFHEGERFSHYRDENEDLHIKFNDGRDIKVAIVPLRPYQKEDRHKLFIEKIRNHFIVRSRRGGKEVESWQFIIEGAIEDPGTYYMIYPTFRMAKRILWEGNLTLEDGTIMKFLNMIPSEILLKPPNNSEFTIQLKNGSTIYVLGSDSNIDSLRGGNLKGAVCSEYAFADPRVRKTIMPSLIQNKGWIFLQTTFNGRNHAWQDFHDFKSKDKWFCKIESCLTLLKPDRTRYITEEMVQEARDAGSPEWFIRQEYYCEVVLNEDLFFFAVEMQFIRNNNQIAEFPFDPSLTCFRAWDLGTGDATVCILFQLDHFGNPIILHTIEANNKPWQYYIQESNQFANRRGLMIQNDFIPHDGANKKAGATEVTTTELEFASLGCSPIVIKRVNSKVAAIQLMRNYIRRSRIHSIHAERAIECLESYEKVWDEKLNCFRQEPLHNWASHCADAYQTMCLAIESGLCVTYDLSIESYNL